MDLRTLRSQSVACAVMLLAFAVGRSCMQAASSIVLTDSAQLLDGGESVTVIDSDGDGDLDVIIGQKLYENPGSGWFVSRGSLTDNSVWRVAAGDVDGDATTDLWVAGRGENNNWLHRNGGSHDFSNRYQLPEIEELRQVMLIDLNADGHLDAWTIRRGNAVLANQTSQVWLNDGAGVFTAAGEPLATPHARSVAFADLNQNGLPDAVVTMSTGIGNSALPDTIWLNEGGGLFQPSHHSLPATVSEGIALGDLNGSGFHDIVVAQLGRFQPLFNDGNGVFTPGAALLDNLYGQSVVMADFDGDGDLDVLVTNRFADRPGRLFINDGQGGFSMSEQAMDTGSNLGAAVDDFNGDGSTDVVLANITHGRVLLNGISAGLEWSVQNSETLVITFQGILETADQIEGPYFIVPDYESPEVIALDAAQRFFRVR